MFDQRGQDFDVEQVDRSRLRVLLQAGRRRGQRHQGQSQLFVILLLIGALIKNIVNKLKYKEVLAEKEYRNKRRIFSIL